MTVSGDLTIDTSTLVVDSTNNRVGILDATPAVSLDAGSATDAFFVPKGTTAQRPTGVDGYFRYNTDDAQFEGYADGEWGAIAGSGSGSAIEPQIFAGDGSTVDFTLTSAPTSENNLLVFIDGVFQAHDSYSVSGTTLTFSTAPANTRVVTVYHARSSISGSNMIVDTMTGDNSDVTLTLSVAPVSENNVQVYFDGVYQSKANYSISGTTLTFSTAPATGVAVEAITHTQTTINEPAANTVTPAKIAAGDFYFDTDTLYIDSTNNRVGVGVASPAAELHVSGDSIANTFKLIANTSVSGSDATIFRPADNTMAFSTNGAERIRILSSGGITFNGDTAAANALDDYEEGTWTPSVNAGSISGTSITYQGAYTKVGRMVFISLIISSPSADLNVSSYVQFSGVPFAITYKGTGTVVTEDIDQFDRQGFVELGSTFMSLSNCGSASGTGVLSVGLVGATS